MFRYLPMECAYVLMSKLSSPKMGTWCTNGSTVTSLNSRLIGFLVDNEWKYFMS
jgi:hypothetical protein